MFGRFVPDFGRVVAQMQFDMYHHYTVDEHSIRAIGLLAAIERGELKDDHPLSTAIIQADRVAARALCRGAAPRHRQGPRRRPQRDRRRDRAQARARASASTPAETETVAWLVRYHLLMSSTAFKRDLADPKTIEDFVRQVQSPERLRLLLILTVVDIRAVGPGVWNDWKRHAAADLVRSRRGAAAARPQAARPRGAGRSSARRSWPPRSAGRRARRGPMPGACPTATGSPSRRRGRSPMPARSPRPRRASAMPSRASSSRTTPRAARPGSASSRPTARPVLPHLRRRSPRPARNIIDARIHTTRDGMALDNLLVLDGTRAALFRPARCAAGWSSRSRPRWPAQAPPPLPGGRRRSARSSAFEVAPSVAIADRASTRTTVVEVNARDRPALLAGLAAAIHDCGHHDPFGAHRDLWRARGRRLLPDARRRQEARRDDDGERLRAALLERPATAKAEAA